MPCSTASTTSRRGREASSSRWPASSSTSSSRTRRTWSRPRPRICSATAACAGDGVSELVVRGIPQRLAPGAFACVLIAWALDPDDPTERPRTWLEGSGCDAFLLHTSTDDPIETATLWNRDLVDRPEAYADALDRWLAYYRELGIEHLGYACLVLRKRADGGDDAAAGWVEALQLPRSGAPPGRTARGAALRDARPPYRGRRPGAARPETARRGRGGRQSRRPLPRRSVARGGADAPSRGGPALHRRARPTDRARARGVGRVADARAGAGRGGRGSGHPRGGPRAGAADARDRISRARRTRRTLARRWALEAPVPAPGPSSRSCPCGRETPPLPSGPARRSGGACRSRGRRQRSPSRPSR